MSPAGRSHAGLTAWHCVPHATLPSTFRSGDFMKLDGQAALITGASRGLGLVIARALAAEGAAVACVARASAELEQAVAALTREGRRAIAAPADVTRAAEVAAAVARTVEAFGRLDIVVLNAGTWMGGSVVDTPEA